MTEIIQWRSF